MGLQRAGTQAAGALIGGVGLLVWNALVTGDAVGLSIDRKTLLSADTRSCSAGPGIGVFVWRAPPANPRAYRASMIAEDSRSTRLDIICFRRH